MNGYFISGKRNSYYVKTAEKFRPVIAYIEEHYREKITIKELAEIMNVSKVYFFKQL